MSLTHDIPVEYVSGVEGPSLYIGGFRVAGNKPWGGGKVIHSWQVSLDDLLRIPAVAKHTAATMEREEALRARCERLEAVVKASTPLFVFAREYARDGSVLMEQGCLKYMAAKDALAALTPEGGSHE